MTFSAAAGACPETAKVVTSATPKPNAFQAANMSIIIPPALASVHNHHPSGTPLPQPPFTFRFIHLLQVTRAEPRYQKSVSQLHFVAPVRRERPLSGRIRAGAHRRRFTAE